ncbi:MAG TPA: hypothetical protein VJN29_14385 [Intrasporangium sp.]|nr:hypothetical protein [Intrasporangium sp.]
MGGSLVADSHHPTRPSPGAGGHQSDTRPYAAELAQRHTAE